MEQWKEELNSGESFFASLSLLQMITAASGDPVLLEACKRAFAQDKARYAAWVLKATARLESATSPGNVQFVD